MATMSDFSYFECRVIVSDQILLMREVKAEWLDWSKLTGRPRKVDPMQYKLGLPKKVATKCIFPMLHYKIPSKV